jgi:dihydrofolate reductase
MKIILYMAQSLNGFIAKENDDVSWIGKADKQKFEQETKRAGNLVMGRNTYEAMQADGNFPLRGRLNVVMTRDLPPEPAGKDFLFTSLPPGEVVNYLQGEGFEQAMIVGGGKLAKSFLEEQLIDELYVTVEPVLFGHGVPFIESGDFLEEENLQANLKLLEVIKLSEDEIQLRYLVKKVQELVSDTGEEIVED